jgi:xylulokinase
MYLGLDLGTSGLRGLLVCADGTPVGDATAEYPLVSPQEGWFEQDPADWIRACKNVVSQLRSRHRKEVAALKGIGVAGHMHGATTVDRQGKVIRPCILWNDTRAATEAAELDAMPEFRALSGNIVFAGFTAPKLMWMKRYEADNFARVAKVLLPKDYLVYWLTGRFVSEMSDAAGTSWLDVGARDWSALLLERSGMSRGQIPNLVEGCDPVGELERTVAAELALPRNVGVVGGAGDNAAAACGIGAFEEGQGFLSLGTSGVLLAAKNEFAPHPASAVHTFCHAVPGKWYQMGVTLSATDSLNWLAANLGRTAQDLAAQLPGNTSGPCAVRFLPYLSGERTPHNDVHARAAFIGMSRATDDTVLCQSVMEGVSFALRDCLQALQATTTDLRSVFAIGGGSGSAFWVQTLANTLNLVIALPARGDFGAALGAARLAMVGVGGASPANVMTQPEVQRTFEPDSNLVAAYETAYQKYTQTYTALKEIS